MLHVQHNPRLIVIFFTFVFLYLIVLGNLFRVQVTQNLFFSHLGQQQYKVTVVQTPTRAEIYDRSGIQPLAMTEIVYQPLLYQDS